MRSLLNILPGWRISKLAKCFLFSLAFFYFLENNIGNMKKIVLDKNGPNFGKVFLFPLLSFFLCTKYWLFGKQLIDKKRGETVFWAKTGTWRFLSSDMLEKYIKPCRMSVIRVYRKVPYVFSPAHNVCACVSGIHPPWGWTPNDVDRPFQPSLTSDQGSSGEKDSRLWYVCLLLIAPRRRITRVFRQITNEFQLGGEI